MPNWEKKVKGKGLENLFSEVGKVGIDITMYYFIMVNLTAGVAQQVEQLTCNQQAGGSNPFASS